MLNHAEEMQRVLTAEEFHQWVIGEAWVEAVFTEENNENRTKSDYISDFITRLQRIQDGEI